MFEDDDDQSCWVEYVWGDKQTGLCFVLPVKSQVEYVVGDIIETALFEEPLQFVVLEFVEERGNRKTFKVEPRDEAEREKYKNMYPRHAEWVNNHPLTYKAN